MTSGTKEDDSVTIKVTGGLPAKAMKLGLFATASAVLGGLAVAWWYRDTLNKLRNPVVYGNLPKTEAFNPEFPDAAQDEFSTSEAGNSPHIAQD